MYKTFLVRGKKKFRSLFFRAMLITAQAFFLHIQIVRNIWQFWIYDKLCTSQYCARIRLVLPFRKDRILNIERVHKILSHYLLFLYFVQLSSTSKHLFHYIWSKYYFKNISSFQMVLKNNNQYLNSDLSLARFKSGFSFLLHVFVFCDFSMFLYIF